MPSQDIYRPEAYSQDQVNAGQRKINYALTKVDEKFLNALIALKDALDAGPGHRERHFADLEAAITDLSNTIKRVAEIKPPGCDTTWG